jgi:hypothetical protein
MFQKIETREYGKVVISADHPGALFRNISPEHRLCYVNIDQDKLRKDTIEALSTKVQAPKHRFLTQSTKFLVCGTNRSHIVFYRFLIGWSSIQKLDNIWHICDTLDFNVRDYLLPYTDMRFVATPEVFGEYPVDVVLMEENIVLKAKVQELTQKLESVKQLIEI